MVWEKELRGKEMLISNIDLGIHYYILQSEEGDEAAVIKSEDVETFPSMAAAEAFVNELIKKE